MITTSQLVHFADQGRLVAFVGAGVSMVPPTCLPSWSGLNEAVLHALAGNLVDLLGEHRAGELARLVVARQEAELLPPEYQAELISNRLRHNYFHVLQCLNSNEPNDVHLQLAALGHAGKLRAIITTNFDRALEAAFTVLGVPLDVHSDPRGFEALAADLKRFERGDHPCQLLKLHGSAENPETLIDTLAQRKKGFPEATSACIRHLLRFGHWLFLGYSGADLESDTSYLHLRGDAAEAVGFTWLVRTSTEPLAAVVRTRDIYADRGTVEAGELPDWLQAKLGHLATPAVLSPTLSEADLIQRKKEANDRVTRHARDWSTQIDTNWCGVVLADLLRAVGQPQAGIDVLVELKAATGNSLPPLEHAAILTSLAGMYSDSGKPHEAIDLYQAALILFPKDLDRQHHVRILNNLALVNWQQGNYDKALALFEQAQAAFRESGDAHGEGITLHNIALVHIDKGEWQAAEDNFRRELAVIEAAGDVPNRALLLSTWGDLLVDQLNFETAKSYFDEALSIRKRLGDDRGRAQVLGNLAKMSQVKGDYSIAEKHYNEILSIFERLDDLQNCATTLANLATIAWARGNANAARENLERARHIAVTNHYHPQAVRFCLNLADWHRERGTYEEAEAFLREALEYAETSGTPGLKADVLNQQGVIDLTINRLDAAREAFTEALAINRKIGRRRD
jgi:tetratricopeptide (TPR) repeat protein